MRSRSRSATLPSCRVADGAGLTAETPRPSRRRWSRLRRSSGSTRRCRRRSPPAPRTSISRDREVRSRPPARRSTPAGLRRSRWSACPRRSNDSRRRAGRRDDEALRCRGAAVGRGAAVELDARSIDVPRTWTLLRAIPGSHDPRPGEGERATQPVGDRRRRGAASATSRSMRARPGDVAALRGVLKDRREVEPLDVDLPLGAHRRPLRRRP